MVIVKKLGFRGKEKGNVARVKMQVHTDSFNIISCHSCLITSVYLFMMRDTMVLKYINNQIISIYFEQMSEGPE